jgi:hypothetical protein
MAHDDDDDDLDDGDEDGEGAPQRTEAPAPKMPMATVAVLGAAAILCVGLAVVLLGGDKKGGQDPKPAAAVAAAAAPVKDPLADVASPSIDLGALVAPGAPAGGTPAAPGGNLTSPVGLTPAPGTMTTPAGTVTANPAGTSAASKAATPATSPAGSQAATPPGTQATAAVAASQATPAPPQATPGAAASQATPAPVASQPTPAPAAPAGTPDPNMSYDKAFLATLAGKAASGGLSDAEISHLKAAPPSNDGFGRAYALLAAQYEAKKNYKAHCEVSTAVQSQGAYRYNPDWNLEVAKCRLRNAEYDGAAKAADNVVSGQMDLAAQTRTARVMLAYQIKAKARTAQYEADAKKNSGFGDERLLNMAVSAWKEVKNWAQNINDPNGAEAANRELSDLENRRAPKTE